MGIVYDLCGLSRRPADRAADIAALISILIVATCVRVWFVSAGVPYAVGVDEPQVVDRALRILHTGDWNTHLFDYPTLVIYFHAVLAIARFMWGAVSGDWSSLDTLDIGAIYTTGRIATAAIGVATVWITYRLGSELGSRQVGLLAAVQLAVYPMHVRESHFILTDVPVTALTTLTVWLAVRAGRVRVPAAYAWAGAAAGLAAAAKYNGGIAFIAIVVVWLLQDRRAPDRWSKLVAAIAAMSVAFLLAAPYTLLDLPAFLNGFAAQFARFAGGPRSGDPAWLVYVKHLSLAFRFWVPLALVGAAIVVARRDSRSAWTPLLAFVAAYFYALSTHAPIFGRYALPLIPGLCLLAAVPLVGLGELLRKWSLFDRPAVQRALFVTVSVAMAVLLGATVVNWLLDLRRADTRTLAAVWMKQNLPRGTAVAVENSGPTYLANAGFRVVPTELLIEHPPDWYRRQVGYLVISSRDPERYVAYEAAGPIVFEIAPTPQRWGPPIRIVKLQ